MEYLELLNTYNKQGYVYEYWLMGNGKTKMVFKHRRIWEQKIGRIPKGYAIHHIDKDKRNNKIGILYNIISNGVMVYQSGNLMCLPEWLHSKLYHNVNGNGE